MPVYKNNSPGPRILNAGGGAPGVVIQMTLLPGESREVEPYGDPQKDVALQAMIQNKEIEEVSEVEPMASIDPTKVAEMQQEATEAVQKARTAAEQLQAAEMDANRLTVPRQFASDGGPKQVPTVDGKPGAPTPAQEEQVQAKQQAQAKPKA